MRILRKKEVIAMQMYEVTALAPEGPEEVYQAMVFAEDEDDACLLYTSPSPRDS